MRQCRASHQFLIGFQGLEYFQRIFHMVNIQHHQTVQMTVCQPTMTKRIAIGRRRCVKLIATENERHKVVLQLLSKSQQTLFVALLKELLTRTEFLQTTLLSQKLSIVLILQPLARDLRIVLLHSLEDLPSAVNLPGSRGVPHAVPELLSAALDSLREVSVFLITESLIHNCQLSIFNYQLQGLQISDVQSILMSRLAVLVLPCAMLPEALGHVRLVLEELRVALLRGILASQFTIHLVATVLQHYTTTLEMYHPVAGTGAQSMRLPP